MSGSRHSRHGHAFPPRRDGGITSCISSLVGPIFGRTEGSPPIIKSIRHSDREDADVMTSPRFRGSRTGVYIEHEKKRSIKLFPVFKNDMIQHSGAPTRLAFIQDPSCQNAFLPCYEIHIWLTYCPKFILWCAIKTRQRLLVKHWIVIVYAVSCCLLP